MVLNILKIKIRTLVCHLFFHKGSPKDVQVFKGQMVRFWLLFLAFPIATLTSSGC